MAKTVIEAFDTFLKEIIEIEKEENKTAKGSRDWLIENINKFDADKEFFKLYSDVNLSFGSFSRKTKIRPLDDIDLMIGINAEGSTYNNADTTETKTIFVPPDASYLRPFCNDGTNTLNSKKVINAFISKLSSIPQYRKAEIKRNEAACTLDLTSYPWVFDIVPCFYTNPDYAGRTYYLIPDGKGTWQKTDPRIDQKNVTDINQKHQGNILRIIRVVKYWQKRATMPSMPSYLLEVIILRYYQNKSDAASTWPDVELPDLFNYIAEAVLSDVTDPKGIEGNINNLTLYEKLKINERGKLDSKRAKEAREQEIANHMENSINKWRDLFGPEFPKYE